MKIVIDNLHIEKVYLPDVPRETTDIKQATADITSALNNSVVPESVIAELRKRCDEKDHAYNKLRQRFDHKLAAYSDVSKEVENLEQSNVFLRAKLAKNESSHVSLETHRNALYEKTGVITRMREELRELAEEHREWGDKNDRLEARRKELDKANVKLRRELELTITENDKLHGEVLELNQLLALDKGPASTTPANKEETNGENPVIPPKPMRKHRANMTKEEVWQVRRFFKAGRKNIWIINQTGLDDAAVSRLRTGKSYKSVPPEPKGKPVCLRVGWGITGNKKETK